MWLTCKTEVRLQIKNTFLEIYKMMEKIIFFSQLTQNKDNLFLIISAKKAICYWIRTLGH